MPEQTESVANQLRKSVTETLAQTSEVIRDRVHNFLVDQELQKRQDTVLAVLTKRQAASKSLSRLKEGDIKTFNADGTVATHTYSKARLDDIKKEQENLSRIDKALAEAFAETPDFGRLYNIASGEKKEGE